MGKIFALGLSGYAGSGKTTAALYLEEYYGFKRLHIAETLREMLTVLMRARGIEQDMIDRYLTGDLKDGVVIPEFGCTSRHLQITLGTEWGRHQVNDDLWCDIWTVQASNYRMPMNDSVRFENEAMSIQANGGVVIRIERPNCGPVKFYHPFFKWLYGITGVPFGAHPSERIDLIQADEVIDNDGTVEELHAKIDMVMHDLGVSAIRLSGGVPVGVFS